MHLIFSENLQRRISSSPRMLLTAVHGQALMIISTYSQRNKQKTKQKQMREAFPYPGTRWAVMSV
jgi:hypothetical protein